MNTVYAHVGLTNETRTHDIINRRGVLGKLDGACYVKKTLPASW